MSSAGPDLLAARDQSCASEKLRGIATCLGQGFRACEYRRMEIITPSDYVGALMELSQQRRGEFVDMQYLTPKRTTLVYNMPLAEVMRGPTAQSVPIKAAMDDCIMWL